MIEVVWNILRHNNRFLLAQRSIHDCAGGTWVFPGGKRDPEDRTIIDAARRELNEEVGIEGTQFEQLCSMHLDKYHVQVFYCNKWHGNPKPACSDIIGVGWFTLAEMYALGKSIAPFMNNSLMYLAYLIQHYDHHPNEWRQRLGECDENG